MIARGIVALLSTDHETATQLNSKERATTGCGLARANAHSVVHRELLIRGIEIGIVAAGASHCRFRVIGYRQRWYPTENVQFQAEY